MTKYISSDGELTLIHNSDNTITTHDQYGHVDTLHYRRPGPQAGAVGFSNHIGSVEIQFPIDRTLNSSSPFCRYYRKTNGEFSRWSEGELKKV